MPLITIYEPNWERTTRAAYAEQKDNNFVQNKVNEIRNLINSNHYLYKIEETSNGTFIGFVIYKGNGVPTSGYNGDMIPIVGHIRPQFNLPLFISEYNVILTTIVNNNI